MQRRRRRLARDLQLAHQIQNVPIQLVHLRGEVVVPIDRPFLPLGDDRGTEILRERPFNPLAQGSSRFVRFLQLHRHVGAQELALGDPEFLKDVLGREAVVGNPGDVVQGYV